MKFSPEQDEYRAACQISKIDGKCKTIHGLTRIRKIWALDEFRADISYSTIV